MAIARWGAAISVIGILLGSALILTVPQFIHAEAAFGQTYNSRNGFTVVQPQGWNIFTQEFTAMKGGKVETVFITQTTDLVSRTTKYFSMVSGSPDSVFGLNKKVVDRLSRDEMVDFIIDQETNLNIDYKVTKTSTKGEGENKVYMIEANYAVPGYRAFRSERIQFKNGKAYWWSTMYLGPFANYATTLQGISDSVTFQ